MLGNFACFLSSAVFLFLFFFLNLSGIPSFFRPDLGPNCLQRLSADDANWHRVSSQVPITNVVDTVFVTSASFIYGKIMA